MSEIFFHNPYDSLINSSQTILSQLKKIKKSCFKPYITNEQLIKYICEDCSKNKIFKKCLFYEFINLENFKKDKIRITNDKNILPPKKFNKNTERLCFNKEKHDLKNILFNYYEYYTAKKQNLNKDIIQKKLTNFQCYGCNWKKYCSFFVNNIFEILCITDIISIENNEIICDETTKIEYHGKYITKSFLYKKYIQKDIQVKMNEKNNLIYSINELNKYKENNENIFNSLIKINTKNNYININDYTLLNLLKSQKLTNIYISCSCLLNENESIINSIKISNFLKKYNVDLKIEEIENNLTNLNILEKINFDNDLKLNNYTKRKIFYKNYISINVEYFLNLCKIFNSDFYSLIYLYFLYKYPFSIRNEIQKHTNLSAHLQKEVENKIHVKKISPKKLFKFVNIYETYNIKNNFEEYISNNLNNKKFKNIINKFKYIANNEELQREILNDDNLNNFLTKNIPNFYFINENLMELIFKVVKNGNMV